MCCQERSGISPVAGSGKGDKVLEAGKSQIGKPYAWGDGNKYGASKEMKQTIEPFCYDGNNIGFDCSGLTLYSVYQGCGVELPRTAADQYNYAKTYGKLVSYISAQPGDILFYNSGGSISHVAIFSRAGKRVHAPGHYPDCTPKLVQEDTIYQDNLVSQVGRFC